MTKTDLHKDITAKFDSFDEKHLLRLNLNKNLNLFLETNESYPTLCMLLHTTEEFLRERYRVQTHIYTLCLYKEVTIYTVSLQRGLHGCILSHGFPIFQSLVTKCFLLIFTEFGDQTIFSLYLQSLSTMRWLFRVCQSYRRDQPLA